MHIDPPRNRNYCATVVALSDFAELPNCDNVKAALIFGNSVIVSKDAQPGDVGLFFPVETALDTKFCGANNLFRKPEWGNAEPDKKGFFEEHGRVKAVRFRGHKSEGFWIPISSLDYAGATDLPLGSEFDRINGFDICRKYTAKTNRVPGTSTGRQASAEERIVDGQFRFHIDTDNLQRNSHKLDPAQWISVSDKWHGTSAIFANILVKRDLTWMERLLKRLGVKIEDSRYGLVWSSRRVVKGINGAAKDGVVHFYDSDIWGVVAGEIAGKIPQGYTVYGEIVGFTTDGAAIQKGYAYGCGPGQHKLVVYRASVTSPDGTVLELSWQQLKDFCDKHGLEMVRELFHGRAWDLLNWDGTVSLSAWQEAFVAVLQDRFVRDQMCPYNGYAVPAEGIVIKIERLDRDEAYKLKNFKFLERETKMLDKGEADLEEQQSEIA